jgi:hypothetical protein
VWHLHALCGVNAAKICSNLTSCLGIGNFFMGASSLMLVCAGEPGSATQAGGVVHHEHS